MQEKRSLMKWRFLLQDGLLKDLLVLNSSVWLNSLLSVGVERVNGSVKKCQSVNMCSSLKVIRRN